jgi:hypothetical protein
MHGLNYNIVFDQKKNHLSFEGVFMSDYVWDKDGKIMDEIQTFLENRRGITVQFNVEYADSRSIKVFLQIIQLINTIILNGHEPIDVIWNYDPEDESVFELGNTLNDISDIPIKMVSTC